MNSNRTPEKILAFCAVLSETCNVGKACLAVGMGRTTAYDWREDDPDFAAAWDRAVKIGVTALEDEMHRRAYEGVDEPVFYQGYECGTVRKYSDTLAIFLAKAHDPKYRDCSKVELAGNLNLTTMSQEEIDQELAELAAREAMLNVVISKPDDDFSDLV